MAIRTEGARRTVRLTTREIEILTLIGQGRTSQEVADSLYVSKRTVDFHLLNAYSKLNVSNRVKALRRAQELGLMPFQPTTYPTANDLISMR